MDSHHFQPFDNNLSEFANLHMKHTPIEQNNRQISKGLSHPGPQSSRGPRRMCTGSQIALRGQDSSTFQRRDRNSGHRNRTCQFRHRIPCPASGYHRQHCFVQSATLSHKADSRKHSQFHSCSHRRARSPARPLSGSTQHHRHP